MELDCRLYERRYPETGDVVLVRIRNVEECAHMYAELLEYGHMEGVILVGEISRSTRRIRSMPRGYHPGDVLCVRVIRVDPEKGYIDLSRRYIPPEERQTCRERCAKTKCALNIMKTVAISIGIDSNEAFEDMMNKAVWHFDRKYDKLGAAYDIFKEATMNTDMFADCDLENRTIERILDVTRQKLSTSTVKVKAAVAVTCYGRDGVDAVREALGQGRSLSTVSLPVKVTYLNSPLYEVTVTSKESADVFGAMNIVLEKIKHAILDHDGGSFLVKTPAAVVSRVFGEDEEVVYSLC